MNCEQVNEAAGAYALATLPPEEMREVEAHLRECNLHTEIASLRVTASLLAFAAEEREPPTMLRSRIMTAIAAQDLQTAPPAPIPLPERRTRRIPRAYALAAAFAIFAFGLLIWNVALLRDDDSPSQIAVPQPTAVTRQVNTGAAAGTLLRYLGDEHVAILEVAGLEQLAPNRVYQVWTLSGPAVTGVGLFTVGDAGTARMAFSSPLQPGDTVAVTEEPAGGSPAPTSQPIFAIEF